MWNVYVCVGRAFIPDVAKTEAGFFLDVEPVRTVELGDLPALAAALDQAMANGNPLVQTPARSSFPKPVVLKLAGVKNWNTFMKRARCFTILRGESEIEIAEAGRDEKGAWIESPSLHQGFSLRTSSLELARHIVERARQRF